MIASVRARAALAGLLAATPLLAWLRGFTVDDALIPARYAAHIARGEGYRFSVPGPVTDGVTPLGWPLLLAPFAADGPPAALAASRALGIIAWLGAAALLGVAIDRSSDRPRRWLALALVLASGPLAAWSVAGLETGVVIALATVAACVAPGPRASLVAGGAAGLVAWLRPEAIAFAAVLGAGRARELRGASRRAVAAALAVAPFLVAATIRAVLWGRPAPLAVLAKPSDLAHGAAYVAASALLAGGPVAVLAPLAWRRLGAWPRALLVASGAHLASVAAAGGDWMPLSRLVAPVLPALALVAAHLFAAPSRWAPARLAIAVAGQLFALVRAGPAASRVLAHELAYAAAARAPLAGARTVATIDVGWVGVATDAPLLDLAGVTDPDVAALPGGHTSKLVPATLIEARGVDRLVLELAAGSALDAGEIDARLRAAADGAPGRERTFARAVEERLAREPRVASRFAAIATTPADLPVRYAILARRAP